MREELKNLCETDSSCKYSRWIAFAGVLSLLVAVAEAAKQSNTVEIDSGEKPAATRDKICSGAPRGQRGALPTELHAQLWFDTV